jgi:Na+-translocating ferredoxin:NAD+ oxidoreductase subunit G
MSMGMTSAPPAVAKNLPSWRLISLMTAAGAVAGLLIVSVYQLTLPRIQHHQGEVMAAAISEVLKAPARLDTLYLVKGALTKRVSDPSARGLERVFLGYDAAGRKIGFALSAIGNGFQEPVTVMFGYDATAHAVIAMRVIANKETPGLGDKIVKDTMFINEFVGVTAPIAGVKPDRKTGASQEVVMITGATISSRAVIQIINNAVARWQPLIDAYMGSTS